MVVHVRIAKINIRSIDESDMTFSVTTELWQFWKDFRLIFPNWTVEKYQMLDSSWIDKLWNPKLYFMNAVDGKLDNIITPSSFFWLSNNTNIIYCSRVILKLVCEMDLRFFPHDEQQCSILMTSAVYSSSSVVFKWLVWDNNLQLFSLQQFKIAALDRKVFNQTWGPNNITVLQLSIQLRRQTGYYIINVYIPTVLIVIMSMLTFWIPPDAVPARVTLGVTSLLTIITKQYQASMPSVSYVVALNVWLSSCIAFVFFSLLEFAAVIALSTNAKKPESIVPPHPDLKFPMVMLRSNGTWSMKNNWSIKKSPTEKKEKRSLPKMLDYISRGFFPLSFIIFCVTYWQHYN